MQIIPHITDEIKGNIYALEGPEADVAIVEIGGTVVVILLHPLLRRLNALGQPLHRLNIGRLYSAQVLAETVSETAKVLSRGASAVAAGAGGQAGRNSILFLNK